MSVGFVCPHDKFNWDQVPAPGGFGVEIVGKCIDCGVKLSPQQVKALSAKKMAFDGAISQLRSSGQHEKAQAIELARDGISKIRDVARHYSKLMDAANEAQAAQLSLPALAETIPDSTWKALGLPPKDTVRATLEAMINPIEQLRALVRVTINVTLQDPNPSIGYYEMSQLGEHDEAIAAIFRSRSLEIRRVITGLIRDAQKLGELVANADVRAIVDSVSGLVWAVGAGASTAPNDAVRHQILMSTDLLLGSPSWLAR